MPVLRLRGILGSFGAALVLTALGSGPLQAGSINFTTTFLDSSGNNPLGPQYFARGGIGGYEKVTFTGSQSTGADTSDLPFLHLMGSMSSEIGFLGQPTLVQSVPFILRISQSGSGATLGSADVHGSLALSGQTTLDLGLVSVTLDTFSVTLNQTSVSIGNVNYQLGGFHFQWLPSPHYSFTPYNTDGSPYTISNTGALVIVPFTIGAQITDPPMTPVPEPPALASVGSGVLALTLVWLLRKPSRRPEPQRNNGSASA